MEFEAEAAGLPARSAVLGQGRRRGDRQHADLAPVDAEGNRLVDEAGTLQQRHIGSARRRADSVVIFGVTGDLVSKKIFPALYELARRDRLDGPVVGVARTAWSDEKLIDSARRSVLKAKGLVDEEAFGRLARRLTMVSGNYADPAVYSQLAEVLADSHTPVFYLATPPSVFPAVIDGLDDAGLAARGRAVVEKPFGSDIISARNLDASLLGAFDNERIFRIDHYLGKESVEGIQTLRFDNRLFEPLWDREHISRFEVTLAEEFGTEGRAGFYDGVGAIRDVLQNHMLQIVAYLAMERPKSDDLDALQQAQADLLQQVRALSVEWTVRGQYAGYLAENGVEENSTTETYVATELFIDSDRWRGVPFRLRTGKHLPLNAVEVVVEFRRPATLTAAGEDARRPDPNLVRFRLGRSDGVTISIQAKEPGRRPISRPISLAVDFDGVLGHRQDAYERLIDDVLDGDQQRFASPQIIEQEWRIVTPILDLDSAPLSYEPGTWGPETPAGQPSDDWYAVGLTEPDSRHEPAPRADEAV
jgi:glucose-6-phosphate 1-dehydrogenase